MAKRSNPRAPSTPIRPWQWLLLVAWPLLVYGRSLLFGFVMHDDDKMVSANPAWAGNPGWKTAFTTDAWFMEGRIELYRPWQSLTYMIDHAIGGVQPFMYHLHNLLALVAGLALLFLFLRRQVSPIIAWAVAMLYGVNLLVPPEEPRRGSPFVGAERGARPRRERVLAAGGGNPALSYGLGVFFLAMLSKESAVALIPVAGLLLARRKTGFKFSPLEWGWLAALLAAFAGFYWLRSAAVADAGNMSLTAFLSNIRSIAEETFKMIVPLGFSVMPGYKILWTIGGILVLGAGYYFLRKPLAADNRWMVGLALWFLPLLPSMAYEPSFAGVAYDYLDHRAWFPFTGLALIIALAAERMWPGNAIRLRNAFIGLLVLWSGVNAWRIGVYKDWHAYYANAISTNPASGLAELNYGALLRDEGKFEEALPHVIRGTELSPDYAEAFIRLSEIYLKMGRYTESADAATRALSLSPDDLVARQFRGSALGAGGNPNAAVADFERILEIDPYNASAIFNLGLAYKETKKYDRAEAMFSQLIAIDPKFPNAFFERAFCRGRLGLFKEARDDLDMSLLIQPDHPPSYFFRGRAWEALGDLDKACADWREAYKRGVTEAEPFLFERCGGTKQ